MKYIKVIVVFLIINCLLTVGIEKRFKIIENVAHARNMTVDSIASDVCDNNIFLTPDSSKVIYIGEDSNGNRCVYKYTYATQTSTQLSGSGAIPIFWSARSMLVSNYWVCWFDQRNGDGSVDQMDVYAADLSTGNEYRITSNYGEIDSLTLADHHIAYANYSSSGNNIYVCDLSTSQKTISPILDSNTGAQLHEGITQISSSINTTNNHAFIVFESIKTSPYSQDIYMYDMDSSTLTAIATSSKVERQPIAQNNVIYYIECNTNDGSAWNEERDTSGGYIKAYNTSNSNLRTVATINQNYHITLYPNFNTANYMVYSEDYLPSSGDVNLYIKAYNYSSNSITTLISSNDAVNWLYSGSMCCDGNLVVYTISSGNYVHYPKAINVSTMTTTSLAANLSAANNESPKTTQTKTVWFQSTYTSATNFNYECDTSTNVIYENPAPTTSSAAISYTW